MKLINYIGKSFIHRDKKYKIHLQCNNNDGTITVFSYDYAFALVGFVIEEDDIKII